MNKKEKIIDKNNSHLNLNTINEEINLVKNQI
jgi:hypothetical protein